MKINSPLSITSRLLPGFRIGGAEVSIGYYGCVGPGRNNYQYFIDHPDFQLEGNDLSGIGGLQGGLECLVSFLVSCSEAVRFYDQDLFPPAVAEWAAQNDSELQCIAIELEESTLIEE